MKLAALLCTALAVTAFSATAAEDTPAPDTANALEGAAKAPLEDLNLIRDKIPPVLLQAEEAAYAAPEPSNCRTIADAVTALDAVLGEDFDAHTAKDETRKNALDEDKARRTGAALAREAASSVVPFRGWVRRLSGAERHAEAVRKAVAAGRVRRGYLKGLGQSMGCKPPAAPLARAG